MLNWLLTSELHFGSKAILWREIIGNLFGLSSALLGMRRKVWSWPIGIIGNALLFTVFMGGVFANPQDKNLYGQSGDRCFSSSLVFTAGFSGPKLEAFKALHLP